MPHRPLGAIRTGPAELSALRPPPSGLWTGPETTTYCVFSVQSFLAWPCWMPEGRAGGVSTSKVALRSISSLKAGRRSFSMSTGAGLPGTERLVTQGHSGSPGQQPLRRWSETFKAHLPKREPRPWADPSPVWHGGSQCVLHELMAPGQPTLSKGFANSLPPAGQGPLGFLERGLLNTPSVAGGDKSPPEASLK